METNNIGNNIGSAMDTGNNIVASIVEPLPVGSAAEASAVSEEAELLNPPALAGISRPTADDNVNLAMVFFMKKFIKNGQVQNVRKLHFSSKELQDPELQLHWQSILSWKHGDERKARDWIRNSAKHRAEVKVPPEIPAKPAVQRSRRKIPDPLADWFLRFYKARGTNISATKDINIDEEFEGCSFQVKLLELKNHNGKTNSMALESLRKRIGSLVNK